MGLCQGILRAIPPFLTSPLPPARTQVSDGLMGACLGVLRAIPPSLAVSPLLPARTQVSDGLMGACQGVLRGCGLQLSLMLNTFVVSNHHSLQPPPWGYHASACLRPSCTLAPSPSIA